jgi:hypothetical protein
MSGGVWGVVRLFGDRNALARNAEKVAKSPTPTVSMMTPEMRPPVVTG